ncbi:putative signal peptide protein [Puccinia sorghi]|uniref:Putative signal peptide protein n=1 Tax=Puccinia sorghi TaxID=27349 RepID=A0A0L6UZW5_9BASI|nr:putative signal peptide protein [Puccinia sorghi]
MSTVLASFLFTALAAAPESATGTSVILCKSMKIPGKTKGTAEMRKEDRDKIKQTKQTNFHHTTHSREHWRNKSFLQLAAESEGGVTWRSVRTKRQHYRRSRHAWSQILTNLNSNPHEAILYLFKQTSSKILVPVQVSLFQLVLYEFISNRPYSYLTHAQVEVCCTALFLATPKQRSHNCKMLFFQQIKHLSESIYVEMWFIGLLVFTSVFLYINDTIINFIKIMKSFVICIKIFSTYYPFSVFLIYIIQFSFNHPAWYPFAWSLPEGFLITWYNNETHKLQGKKSLTLNFSYVNPFRFYLYSAFTSRNNDPFNHASLQTRPCLPRKPRPSFPESRNTISCREIDRCYMSRFDAPGIDGCKILLKHSAMRQRDRRKSLPRVRMEASSFLRVNCRRVLIYYG